MEAVITQAIKPKTEAGLEVRGPRLPSTPCKDFCFVLPDEARHMGFIGLICWLRCRVGLRACDFLKRRIELISVGTIGGLFEMCEASWVRLLFIRFGGAWVWRSGFS